MSTAATLLARKQQLMERLQDMPAASHERDQIERLLARIDDALDQLDEAPERDEEPRS
jgi:hypothetical protein